MELAERIESFIMLGELLRNFGEDGRGPLVEHLADAAAIASRENPWFTPEHIRLALNSLGESLHPALIEKWIAPYRNRLDTRRPVKTIGVVMAGNIPAVGFHDFLCVLVSGHRLLARVSSDDARLIPALADILCRFSPGWKEMTGFTNDRLANFDAVIATGSDNTSRYFDYYFRNYPSIIRHNRNSVAVLTGNENREELAGLADDIMRYFGMGCRNVSKIFVPEGYDFSAFADAIGHYRHFNDHPKYRNNLDYQKAVLMMNRLHYRDLGCLILKEDESLVSRIAVLHYQYYRTPEEVSQWISGHSDRIQCAVGDPRAEVLDVSFGNAQSPALWDYADGCDTMEFLLSLDGN